MGQVQMYVDLRSGKVLSKAFHDTSMCNLKNEEFHLMLNTLESLASTVPKTKQNKIRIKRRD